MTVDNVVVEAGGLCTLSGTAVEGNVKVEEGGDLQCQENAEPIIVVGNAVDGSIEDRCIQ